MPPKQDPKKAKNIATTIPAISSPVNVGKIASIPQLTPLDSKKLLDNSQAIVSNIRTYLDAQKSKKVENETIAMMQMLVAIFDQQQLLISTLFDKVMTPSDKLIDAEEKERLRSFVIYGIAESGEETNRGKYNDDLGKVNSLLDVLDIETGPANVYRMGKQQDNKPRLIKVVMPTSYHKNLVLKNAISLKNLPAFANVFLRPSLTLEQRKADYDLRCQLREAKKNGNNMRIYRGKLVPITNRGN